MVSKREMLEMLERAAIEINRQIASMEPDSVLNAQVTRTLRSMRSAGASAEIADELEMCWNSNGAGANGQLAALKRSRQEIEVLGALICNRLDGRRGGVAKTKR